MNALSSDTSQWFLGGSRADSCSPYGASCPHHHNPAGVVSSSSAVTLRISIYQNARSSARDSRSAGANRRGAAHPPAPAARDWAAATRPEGLPAAAASSPTALPAAQGRVHVTSGVHPPPAADVARAAPPRARLSGSPGRFARVPSAISVTARLYQSARGTHRWVRTPRGLRAEPPPAARARGSYGGGGDVGGTAVQRRGAGASRRRAGLDCSGLAMAPLLPPAMAPRVPAPLLSVSESGRRRRPSARSRRLLLSSSAGAILARQEPGAPRGRRRAAAAPSTRGERPGRASGAASPGDTPSARAAPQPGPRPR